ncbi:MULTISPECIES: hypothetical protein [Commensalibacter]|uniref:Uncharacterized protein n=2 Tax=Commensalibacter TaxID=1079922 RepID=W7DWI9_9PROT|nr:MULTISPECIES: hypothetical protein [Commensalibacter]EUK19445.1 hypothetical protein COMX_06825 [Commensalibacter papalotli (ex Servin-Garciduenas et al. 2014)]CAI3935615.1 unnamed protein product [Commensalibacter papalotli (ex Botero et al. 2024)]CAI3951784.1 unnamed protein product [Commensalibacter papalotli (ex Botero et al. 2024)]
MIKILLRFAGLGMILIVALLVAVFVGDQGPWYFAWMVGTVMIVLISVAGAILFDTQSDPNDSKGEY